MGVVTPTADGDESSELAPGPEIVKRLLRRQAPHLAHLAVREISTSGSSNWVFRLGDELAVRLPRTDGYVPDLLNEVRWLPHIADKLPAPVPRVVAVGDPSEQFPHPWTIVSWVAGDLPGTLDAAQQARLAVTLGGFLRTLHAIDTDGASAGSADWGYRCGEPVTDAIDGWADRAAAELADLFDERAVREAWRLLRDVPPATEPPCLVHCDVSAENVLVRSDGSLAGVIDFGGMGVGDRSIDFLYAWSMLDAPAREQFRKVADVDEETWIRARAWSFVGPGLLTLANYRGSMPVRTERLSTLVEAVAAEVGVQLR